MKVCEVCGAFLTVGDAQSPLDGKIAHGLYQNKSYCRRIKKEKLRKRTEEPDRDERLKKEKRETEESRNRREKGKKERGKDEEKKRERQRKKKEKSLMK